MKILVVTSHRPWEVIEPLETTQAKVKVIRIDAEKGVFQRLYHSFNRTCTAISEFDPDVILLDVYDVPGIATLVVAKIYGVPIVTRVVGDRIGKLKADRVQTQKEQGNYGTAALFILMYSLSVPIFNLSSGLIVLSEDLKKSMVAQTRVPEDLIQIIPVPLRGEKFDINGETAALETHSDKITVLTVTNLKYRKKFEGVCDVLEGMKQLFAERDDIQYRIAGNGTYQQDLQEFINTTFNREDRKQVEVLGFIEDIEHEYRTADIFIYVSYLEGYGNTIKEAQSMQLPVVTNRAEGMKDQIDNFSTGIFIEPENSSEIKNVIAHLADCETHRLSLGQTARETVLRRNSNEVIGRKMITALDKFLSTY